MNMPSKLEVRKISELIPYENNARTHPPEQLEKLRRSLEAFGFVSPVLIDGAGRVIAGHGRIEAAKLAGIDEAPCVLVEHLSDDQRRAYILADNRLAEMGEWDRAMVAGELQALHAAGVDLTLTGFDAADVALTATDDVVEDDCDLTLPEAPVSQRGQIWQLGRHRLMCGDATCPQDVDMSTGGVHADLLLTDPPYGVSYSGAAGDVPGDDRTGSELHNFLFSAFSAAAAVMDPGAAFYCWAPTGDNLELFLSALRESRLRLHQMLIWAKPRAVLGRSDYLHQHEACLHGCKDPEDSPSTYEGYDACAYGWKSGSPHLWCSDRKQTTILEYAKPTRSAMHPTMKPVQMIAYQICNNTLPGAVVLDPFGGSGTTLIAAEQTGRRCCMLEIDPHYCDVIIRRWETFTGQKAVLLDG